MFLFAAAVTIVQHAAHSQSFTNLNFESANVPILSPGQPGGVVLASDGLPGWTVTLGGQEQLGIVYNDPTFGSAAVWLIGPNFQLFGAPIPPLEGRFSAYLTSGGSTEVFPASISQTGLVPAGMQSIQARIRGDAPFVSLSGTEITMFPLSTGPGYTVYGGDISAFSGQVATLSFAALPSPSNPFRGFQLDAITFSAMPVPEPSVIALAAVGAVLLGLGRWHNSRKRI